MSQFLWFFGDSGKYDMEDTVWLKMRNREKLTAQNKLSNVLFGTTTSKIRNLIVLRSGVPVLRM